MKMTKKIFAVLLAVVLAFSLFAVCAAAEGEEEAKFMAVTITTDKGADSYEAGEDVKISVSIACNYNATCFRFPIVYDTSVLKASAVVTVTAKGTCAEVGAISSNKSTDGSWIPENYSGNWGCILVQWLGSVKNGAVGCLNNPEGEVAFEFTLKTNDDASGTGTIFIPEESDLFYNQYLDDPTVADFKYIDDMSSVLSFTEANVTIAGGDVTLIPNEAYNSQSTVDEENLWVYGVEEGITSSEELEAFVIPADPSAILDAVPTDNGFGTGAQLNVVKGTDVLRTYTLIIFGDMSGDGSVDGNDLPSFLNVTSAAKTLEDTAMIFAMDLNGDGDVDGMDLPTMLNYTSGAKNVNQVHPY